MAEVPFIIKPDFSAANKAISSFAKNASKSIGSVEKSFNALKLVAGAAVGILAGREIVKGIGSVIKAANKQEDAVNSLNTALKLAGDFTSEASASMQDFASSLQNTTGIGDETTLQMLALAKSFGVSNDSAQDLVRSAADLSAATGQSLESSVRNLGKTFGGLTGELGELIPDLKEFSKEALESGAAIEFVNARFGGAAASQINTFSGAVRLVEGSFGDLLEELGFLVTRNPDVVNAIKGINSVLKDLIAAVRDNSAQIGYFVSGAINRLVFGAKATSIAIGAMGDAFSKIEFSRISKSFLDIAVGLGAFAGIITGAQFAKSLAVLPTFVAQAKFKDLAKNIKSVVAPIGVFSAKLVAYTAIAAAAVIATDFLVSNFKNLDKIIAGLSVGNELEQLTKKASELEKQIAGTQIGRSGSSFLGLDGIANSSKTATEELERVKTRIAELEAEAVTLNDTLDASGGVKFNFLESAGDGLKQFTSGIKDTIESINELQGSGDVEVKLNVNANDFTNAGKNVGDIIQKSMEDGAEEFRKSLETSAFNIAGALGGALTQGSKGAASITGQIGGLAAGAGALAFGADPQTAQAIQQAVGPLIQAAAEDPEALAKSISDFADAIPGIVDNLARAIPLVAEALAEKADVIIVALAQASPKIAVALAKAMPIVAIELAKALGRLVAGGFDEFSSALANAGPILNDAFRNAGTEFKLAITEGLADILQPISDAFLNFFDQLGLSGNIFSGAIERAGQAFLSSIGLSGGKFSESINLAALGFGARADEQLQSAFANALNTLKNGFSNFSSNLATAGSKFIDSVVSSAGRFIDKLVDEIKGALPTFSGGGTVFAGGGEGLVPDSVPVLGALASGGIIPPGFPNDTFTAGLTSGERVLNVQENSDMNEFTATATAQLAAVLELLQQPIVTSAVAQVDGNALADIILTLNRRNARLTA